MSTFIFLKELSSAPARRWLSLTAGASKRLIQVVQLYRLRGSLRSLRPSRSWQPSDSLDAIVRLVSLFVAISLASSCVSRKVIYRSAKYDFTFSLPASWRGYSVLLQQWEGQTYLPSADTALVTEHGPVFVLRHPQWKVSEPYQDIPIMVFAHSQWESHHQGSFTVGAGGVLQEIGHNPRYVFAVSSRFNADDSVRGWKAAADIVGRNQASHARPGNPIDPRP